MALPKVPVSLYEVTLPSNGSKVTYRGFLGKEEKILLLAMESEEQEQINMSLKQIVTNCTEGSVDPSILPIYDVEFLFLNIIAKSVGEELNLDVLCENCKEEIAYKTNIYDIDVPVLVKGADIVKFSENIGIKLKYPTIDTYDYVDTILDIEGTESSEAIYEALTMHGDYIYDEDGVYYLKDQTKEEIAEFFGNLTGAQMADIKKFFAEMPAISETIEFKCPHCEHQNNYEVRGIHQLFM
jgi:hypothetical protein